MGYNVHDVFLKNLVYKKNIKIKNLFLVMI
jgi:hypothetical protein